jgi:hypothetical protein
MTKTAGKEQEIPGIEVNPANLLLGVTGTGVRQRLRSVLEAVRWFVLKTPLGISSEEINTSAKLYAPRCPPSSAAKRARWAGKLVTRKLR